MPISQYDYNMPHVSAPYLHGGTDAQIAEIRAGNAMLQGVLGTAIDVLTDYEKRTHEANILATETELTKLFTQRTVDVQSTRKLGDTQGLIDDEAKWVDNSKEVARKASKLNDKDFEYLWNTRASNYLRDTGKYQLAEGKKYEEVSKQDYVNLKTNQLAASPLGDLSSLDTLIAETKVLYRDDPKKAQETIDNAVEMYFTLQAMNDPRNTLAYYNANKGALIQRYQASSPEIAKVMKGIESNLRSQQTLALAYENRNLQLEARAQKQRDEEVVNALIANMYGAPNSGAEGMLNYQDAMNEALLSPSISSSAKKQIISLAGTFEKTITGKSPSPQAYGAYVNNYEKALQGELTVNDLPNVVTTMSEAGCSMEQVNKVVTSVNSMNTKAVQADNSFFKIVFDAIDDFNSKQDAMGFKVKGDPLQIQAIKSAFVEHYNNATPEQQAAMRKLSDPNSWTYQFIQGNAVKPSGGFKLPSEEGESSRPFSVYFPGTPSVNVQTGIQGTQTQIQARRPGESLNDYLKRTGME